MIFTRRPRRSIKGNKYAHRVLLARAAREQRGSQFAILGTLHEVRIKDFVCRLQNGG